MTDAHAVVAPGRVTAGPPRTEEPLRLLAAGGLVLTLLGAVFALVVIVTLPADRAVALNSSAAASFLMVGMAALAVAGAAVARQQPRSTMAWLMLGTSLGWVAATLSLVAAWTLLDSGHRGAAAAGWVTNWSWVPANAVSMVMLLRLPTGRLPGPRWRPVETAVLVWAALTSLTTALLPGPLGAEVLAPLTNPMGWEPWAGMSEIVLSWLFAALPVLIVAAAAAPVVRWRRAGTRERSALRWLAVGAVVVAVAAPLAIVSERGEILQGVAGLLLPMTIAAAVLREELWDLDLRRRYDRLRVAREEERERLRRELHDSLGPALGAISMRAEAARNLLAGGDTARVDGLLSSIGRATEDALAEVRHLIDDLGPASLHDHELVPALRIHLAAYAATFPVGLSADPDPLPPLEPRSAATAYLVVAEAVRNAARHSGGTGARVDIRVLDELLHVEVRDDGHGTGNAPVGLGRSGMARRVAAVGGRLTVEDARDGGTLVQFVLPGVLR